MQQNDHCPCGSGLGFSQCCEPFHNGQALPATAEALMRSRFSAYALDNMEYIQQTWDSSTRPNLNKLNFGSKAINWNKLEIISSEKGSAVDTKGTVEFKAYYTCDGEDHILHETSRFIKTNGRWYYLDGVVQATDKPSQPLNEGRNAPCFCGSGKKFKRCCGKS